MERSQHHKIHKHNKHTQMRRVAWWLQLAARQFMTEPRNWVKADASPGSIIITTRQFLGENLETSKNSAKRKGFHSV